MGGSSIYIEFPTTPPIRLHHAHAIPHYYYFFVYIDEIKKRKKTKNNNIIKENEGE
jgi:hypothetical protein